MFILPRVALFAHTARAPVFYMEGKDSSVAMDVRGENAYFIKHPSGWMHEKVLNSQ